MKNKTKINRIKIWVLNQDYFFSIQYGESQIKFVEILKIIWEIALKNSKQNLETTIKTCHIKNKNKKEGKNNKDKNRYNNSLFPKKNLDKKYNNIGDKKKKRIPFLILLKVKKHKIKII